LIGRCGPALLKNAADQLLVGTSRGFVSNIGGEPSLDATGFRKFEKDENNSVHAAETLAPIQKESSRPSPSWHLR